MRAEDDVKAEDAYYAFSPTVVRMLELHEAKAARALAELEVLEMKTRIAKANAEALVKNHREFSEELIRCASESGAYELVGQVDVATGRIQRRRKT